MQYSYIITNIPTDAGYNVYRITVSFDNRIFIQEIISNLPNGSDELNTFIYNYCVEYQTAYNNG